MTSLPLHELTLKRAFQQYAEAQFLIYQMLGPLPWDLKWPVLNTSRKRYQKCDFNCEFRLNMSGFVNDKSHLDNVNVAIYGTFIVSIQFVS